MSTFQKISILIVLLFITGGAIYYVLSATETSIPDTADIPPVPPETKEGIKYLDYIPYHRELGGTMEIEEGFIQEGKKGVLPENSPLKGEYQGLEYEIVGGSTVIENGRKHVNYAVIAGELDESRVELLSSKIVEDVLSFDEDIDEIFLMFSRDKTSGIVDVAHGLWRDGQLEVHMREQDRGLAE